MEEFNIDISVYLRFNKPFPAVFSSISLVDDVEEERIEGGTFLKKRFTSSQPKEMRRERPAAPSESITCTDTLDAGALGAAVAATVAVALCVGAAALFTMEAVAGGTVSFAGTVGNGGRDAACGSG